MNPYDPRNPGNAPPNPQQQQPQQQQPQQQQPQQQQQGWGNAPQQNQGPYGQGQQPQGQPPPYGPPGAYGQGPPQGQAPYGQPGYQQPPYQQGQPAQNPFGAPAYGQPPVALRPAAKSNVGLIIGIVVGVFVLMGAGGAVMFLASKPSDSSSSSESEKKSKHKKDKASEDTDMSSVLQTKAEALLAAVATKDAKKVEDPLLELSLLPDDAKQWLEETFGATLGDKVYADWNDLIFKNLPDLITPFKSASDGGTTGIKVFRVTPDHPREFDWEKSMFKHMAKPRSLYLVTFKYPGQENPEATTAQLYYFAYVNGHFGYLGDMHASW